MARNTSAPDPELPRPRGRGVGLRDELEAQHEAASTDVANDLRVAAAKVVEAPLQPRPLLGASAHERLVIALEQLEYA